MKLLAAVSRLQHSKCRYKRTRGTQSSIAYRYLFTHRAIPAFFGISQPNLTGKNAGKSPPCFLFVVWLLVLHTTTLTINNTLAGVAQLVERVALMTAKRSTSRSWVRAPPSAIPISKLNRAAVLFAFWLSGSRGGGAVPDAASNQLHALHVLLL